MAKDTYPEVKLLKQVKGVGGLIALGYFLTIEDPHRFKKSRDVGCFLGLQPGRRNSGESEPQMHITKEGDRYLRTLLVQGAHYILGPFGEDCDLRRWGRKLSERGGKKAKRRAVVAVARKLAVLLHRLWVSGVSGSAANWLWPRSSVRKCLNRPNCSETSVNPLSARISASSPYRIWDTTQFLLPKVEKHIVGHARDSIFANAYGSSSVFRQSETYRQTDSSLRIARHPSAVAVPASSTHRDSSFQIKNGTRSSLRIVA